MKTTITKLALLCILTFSLTFIINAQEKSKNPLNGLEFRNIGPAMTSGRIADIAIHPENENIWYVAVGSGGVWKTTNSGTTWEALFDKQKVYSIGCVTIDPNNPHTIWVGTGENVGGRHAGFGDGKKLLYTQPIQLSFGQLLKDHFGVKVVNVGFIKLRMEEKLGNVH